MLLPSKVSILGHEYKVIQADDLEDLGICDFTNCTIKINPNQADSQLLDTFLHEIIEAFNFHLQMKLKHRNIQALGTCFHQLLTTNPELLKLFT